jgi:hypothetical protein
LIGARRRAKQRRVSEDGSITAGGVEEGRNGPVPLPTGVVPNAFAQSDSSPQQPTDQSVAPPPELRRHRHVQHSHPTQRMPFVAAAAAAAGVGTSRPVLLACRTPESNTPRPRDAVY